MVEFATQRRERSKEKNSLCQRLATRHGLAVTTTKRTEGCTRRIKRIQETNINTTTIDIFDKSPSHCSLIETVFEERLDQYLNKGQLSSDTKENLDKLQKITDDVKSLTQQLQRSVALNKNNNASSVTLDERLLGEICYQLERRLLLLIFSPSKQFYGYSLRYLPLIIENEPNADQRLRYTKRFLRMEKYLSKAHFRFDHHSIVTFSLINQYGIYFDYQWLQRNRNLLSNLSKIRSFCHSISSSILHKDLEIILHSLELISKLDGKSFFYY